MSYIDDLAARIRSVARVAGPWSWGDRLWGWQVDTCSAVDIGIAFDRRSRRPCAYGWSLFVEQAASSDGMRSRKAPAF
jgi:hypothetical protein